MLKTAPLLFNFTFNTPTVFLPFVNQINPLHPTFFPDWYGKFCYWMAYLNSAVNPIVYGIGNEEFKRTFKNIILLKYFR